MQRVSQWRSDGKEDKECQGRNECDRNNAEQCGWQKDTNLPVRSRSLARLIVNRMRSHKTCRDNDCAKWMLDYGRVEKLTRCAMAFCPNAVVTAGNARGPRKNGKGKQAQSTSGYVIATKRGVL